MSFRILQLTLKAIVSALVVSASIAAPPAQAATGDLDPSFADSGRRAPIGKAGGTALFVETLGPDGILVGGSDADFSGGWRPDPYGSCTLAARGSSFAGRLDDDGRVHRLLDPATVENVEALAFARHSDGRIVVVGRSVSVSDFRCNVHYTPTVFRLNGDGSLDASFGVRVLRGMTQAHSVVLDVEGRIVVAGRRPTQDDPEGHSELVVLRLRTDGRLDASFGNGGYFSGPVADVAGESYFFGRLISRPEIRLIRMDSGNYRAAFASEGDCKIAGVTANGGLDTAFGDSGVVTLREPVGPQATCSALESDSQGRLLVSGVSRNHGFVMRLLSHGAVDPTFIADAAIARYMTAVTSVALARSGKLMIAGSGPQGTSIMRLQAAGGLDPSFGDAGFSWIDLKSKFASNPVVRDLMVRDDGSVIAVGGAKNYDRPFVVRLLGDGGGTSRGVIGFSRGHAASIESDGKAVLRVRRSGGRDGAVSATYRTVAFDAKDHEDFVPESGTLEWADGDNSYKSIAIRLVEGGDIAEAREAFYVDLEDVGGGAGAGTRTAIVDIQPDGSPGGQIEIDPDNMNLTPREANDTFQVVLRRNYYFEGRVCVTLTAKSGTATAGKDFGPKPVTACWHDRSEDWQLPNLQLFNDDRKEGPETFTIELSNPTGGAIIGPHGSMTITLNDDD